MFLVEFDLVYHDECLALKSGLSFADLPTPNVCQAKYKLSKIYIRKLVKID